MAYWDIGMRHIVDVDGQLLAIDAEVIDTASLLEKAGHPSDRQLCIVRAGECFDLQPRQLVRLSKDARDDRDRRPAGSCDDPAHRVL